MSEPPSHEASPAPQVSPPPHPPPPPARPAVPLAMVAALVALLGVVVGYALVGRPGTTSCTAGGPAPRIERLGDREPAPSFRLRSLRGSDCIGLTDFRGQTVVLNFFASWCGPCELEAADLQRTWQAVKGRGITFVGIAIQDQERDAQAFLAKHGITYPAAFDSDGAIMLAYRITGIPTTVFIDVEGRIARRHAGIFVGEEGRARLLAWIEEARGTPR